ncbi:PREDICTED: nesprin-2-like, partial [Gekko japonicus]|uniref:Nesprin-2-like n=1 Tax=Gekko japonicus TaxID=146911 RepID=A0ABM1KZA0_GEKJA
MALKLETETEEYADTETSREELLREWNKLHVALQERMESLKAAWAFVLPMENEWAVLCSLDKQLCEISVRQCLLTDSDLAGKRLKEMQASVADCIAKCNRLEQGSPVGGSLDPVDRQAVCVMVVKYKERFEELGDKGEAAEIDKRTEAEAESPRCGNEILKRKMRLLKSINGLKQKLNRHAVEMKSLKEISSQLSQSKEADEVTRRWTVMEALWNETKLSIAERQEQCAQAIELLKQYHSCKSCLEGITQEQERILSQQASYMGKENLQRTMAKVEMAKKEFNSHSEDIDKINQISKNLQFQLNKMKSFEEPPFENEANVIVDRWLDINERTENYCDNLGRALALWDKLLNLSGSIDLWINSELKNVEDHHLTEEELAGLEAGLQYQEKNLEEFERKVDEIQDLLSGSEPLLELQVIKSSLLNKMELIRKHLPNKSIPAELNGNTAELKGDLDLAKTQIGMTESLLKALSPSNTLEIFTKLEELHQKILQQKHHVTSLQQKTGCLNPDVIELNKQLKSVTDLFNSKKQIFQDHFSTLLNYLCKDFNDWFSGTWMSLKECFDPLETKALLEEKLEQLRSFLAFEGKGDDIHEVETLLSKVKNYLTKATVNQLSIWVRDQEAEVQRLTSKCQAREKELQATLQQFARLEEDFSALEEWLSLQEEKGQEGQKDNPELEHFYQILLKQREPFDSLAWLASSLRQSGFSSDEVVLESTELVDRYKTLLSHVRKNLGVSQALSVEEKNFEELAQSTLSWVQRVKDSISELMYEEAKMPLEEKNMAKLLEGHDEERQRCEELAMRLRATLKEVLAPSDRAQKQVQQNPLGPMERMLQEIVALVESVKQKPSLLQQKFIKDGTDTPQCQPKKRFKSKHEWTEQEAWSIHNDAVKQNNGFSDKTKTQEVIDKTRETDKLVISDIPIAATEDSNLEEGLVEWQERSGLKGSLVESDNLQRSTSQSGKRAKKSRQAPADNRLTDKARPRQQGYQKQLQATGGRSEAPQTTLPLMNGKVMGADLVPSRATHQSPESKGSVVEGVSQKGLAPPENQAIAKYTEMKQKVNDMKIQVAELDVVLVNDQLGEIEHLRIQLEQQKAEALLLSQEECLTATQVSKTHLQDPHSLVSGWDRLLEDLMTIQEAKRHQFHLVNNYQERLAAVRSSMKRLSAGKDHIKTRGPVEGAVLLESIQKCLASVKKERDLLNDLKAQQEYLSRYLKDMDKELMQSQVEEAEQWWDESEHSLQRKQLQVTAEASEFKLLMSKAQALQRSLEQQYHLRTGLSVPSGEANAHPASLAVELQTLKHGAVVFKRDAEMQMKRMWSDAEKGALENAMNDLQNQVEELEQLTPREEVWFAGSSPRSYELMKRIEEAVLWVGVKALHLDEQAALFPDDMVSQIENCQAMIGEAKDKEPALTQLVNEARNMASHLEPGDASGLGSLSSQLQTDYCDLVLKLAQRLQQLESQLGKRQRLFADVERVEAQLAEVERTSASDTCEASAVSDLEQCRAALERIPNAIQEVEGLIDEHLKDFPQGLNIFEQLFLDDCLRSLGSRTKIAYRLIQNRCHTVQRKINAWRKLSEKITTLQQDLGGPQGDELDWKARELLSTGEEAKGKSNGFKERALDIQSSVSHLHRYKEVWECLGLKWDVSRGRLDELQSQLCQAAKGFSAECDGYQMPLSEVEAVVSSLQKDCEALRDGSGSAPETGLISAKILSQRLQQARSLTQEELSQLDKSETLGASLKAAKRQQVKNLGDKIDGLAQAIQSQISALEEKCIPKPDLRSRLDHNLQIWRQVEAELQQPLQVDLETYMILGEKMYCKALEDVMGVELCVAEELMKKERGGVEDKPPNDLQTKLDELQNLRVQLKECVATRISALEEAYRTVKSYNEAVQKAADLVHQHESLLSSPLLSLCELEESCLLPHRTQEEFEAAKAEVETLTSNLRSLIKPNLKPQLEETLCDLVAKGLEIKEQNLKRKSHIQRCFEKYRRFTKSKEKICADLHDIKKIVGKSLYRRAGSYKEALEQSDQSKALASRLASMEEDLVKLRRDLGHLSPMCKENDRLLMDSVMSAMWLKWLSLLKEARGWEGRCEEQSQAWKSVSEEIERETIILDNLQEDLPENPKEKERSTKEELQAFLECANCYEDGVKAEEWFLRLILHRIRHILNIPQGPTEKGKDVPVVREIRVMHDRLKELQQKAQKQKDAVLYEIQDRAKASNEIDAVKNTLQDSTLLLHGVDLEALPERTAKLEEIQRAIDHQKQTFEQIMDRLRIKYSEMYTIVPVEIEKHAEDCKQVLQDLEEKVNTEVLKNSPHYTTDKKIEDINKGLQAIENMLQQKSADVTKAKEIQKRIWDLLDLWHYKMNELDSEVQDTVEQDPCQAQELMDRLMIPLQQYQQVSQRAERRTTQINRAASKMEASDELLKSTRAWLESTNRLLTEEAKSDSAKALNNHASTLQMALEDSEQKQNLLSAMYPELDELSALIETDSMVKRLNGVNEEVAALQQKIVGILPLIQHVADELEAIETEVRTMEKDVDKIKMILSPSEDTLEFSPKEHLKHGQVILAHIGPMKKALREIQSYQESLRLPGVKLQPFSAFQRAKQLLKDLKTLERMTREQNELLEPIVKEMEQREQEIDALKQFLKSHLDESPTEISLTAQAASYPEGEEMEKIKQKIVLLCQTKDDLLMTMKSSLLELHQRHEQSELEDEGVESTELEESGLASGGGTDRQLSKRGSLSLLPSLVEEAEDGSFLGEGESASSPVTSSAECSVTTLGDSAGEADTRDKPAAPEPAQLLHVCQAKVAELEGWLGKVKETLRSEGPARPMQQAVERHLAACQAMLLEIEQKVGSLLEDCKDRQADESRSLQQEAESLSLKLKDVKCNLEKVHGMLQDKYAEGR